MKYFLGEYKVQLKVEINLKIVKLYVCICKLDRV